jgi:hypothetical protein
VLALVRPLVLLRLGLVRPLALLRLRWVVRLVVRLGAQAQAQQEHLVLVPLVQNRAGPVVQAYRPPDELLDEPRARRLQRQSDARVLGERHRRDDYRLRALRCHRRVRRRCRRWQPEEAVQSGGQDQGLQVPDRLPRQRRRVQDERCGRPMTKAKRRHRRE